MTCSLQSFAIEVGGLGIAHLKLVPEFEAAAFSMGQEPAGREGAGLHSGCFQNSTFADAPLFSNISP
jgi:hypothetical protein